MPKIPAFRLDLDLLPDLRALPAIQIPIPSFELPKVRLTFFELECPLD